jgi:hypothetical protein
MAENDVVLEREHMRTIRILVTLLLICVSTIFAQTTSAQLSWEVHSYPLSGTFLQRADFNGDGAPDLMLYGSQSGGRNVRCHVFFCAIRSGI